MDHGPVWFMEGTRRGISGGPRRFVMKYKYMTYFLLMGEKSIQTQEQRKTSLQEKCVFQDKTTLGKLTPEHMRRLIVDDKHKLIYCYVPKAACTNWKMVLYAIRENQTAPYPDPRTIATPEHVHDFNTFKVLFKLPQAERMAKLKNYTKFMFVRDPLVRLVSAYREKFLNHNEAFYRKFGIYILKRYGNMSRPPTNVTEAEALGVHPSFQQFLQYITDPYTLETYGLDEHWRPQHQLCLPCTIKYDFVGHHETLQEDASLLLKMLKIDIAFPPSHSIHIPNNADSVKVWFKSVPEATMKKLYQMYELDFKLFGYSVPQPPLDDSA